MKREIRNTTITWMRGLGLAAFGIAILFVPTLTHAQKSTPDGRQLVITIKDGPAAGLLPGHFLRFNLYNPSPAGTPVARGHVRVFDGRSGLLAVTDEVEICAGCFNSIDIARESFNLPGDPNTGRLQVRAEVEISTWVPNTRSETPAIEFPTSYELVNRESGQTILIGMLLPAVQKVR